MVRPTIKAPKRTINGVQQIAALLRGASAPGVATTASGREQKGVPIKPARGLDSDI